MPRKEFNRKGYKPNPRGTAEFIETLPHATFSDALEGGLKDDDQEIFLYRCVMAVAPDLVRDGKLISRNQGNVGSCVGNGNASAADLTTAFEIASKKEPERWVAREAADATYAMSREVGNMLGGGDGSYGAAAAKALTKVGSFHMMKYDSVDLSTYSVQRCKEWGRRGVPKDLQEKASAHKFGTAAAVTTTDECRQALQNGYGVAVCSGQGFASHRDDNGVAEARGSWAHCMYIAGWRPGLFLIVNSWGPDWISGGVYPEDQPEGSFWAKERVVAGMLRGGDSFALSNYSGFPRQSPWDWARNPQKTIWSWTRGN